MAGDLTWPKPQPIETAPKDGTKVLGFDGCWDVLSYDASLETWVDGDYSSYYPTHWLPLPPAPE